MEQVVFELQGNPSEVAGKFGQLRETLEKASCGAYHLEFKDPQKTDPAETITYLLCGFGYAKLDRSRDKVQLVLREFLDGPFKRK